MKKLEKLDAKTVRIGIAGLVALVVVLVLAINTIGGGSSGNSASTEEAGSGGVVALSEAELLERAPSLPHVAYWVGPIPKTERYELTTTADGRIYLRYLNGGAQAGDPRPNFITVGTYQVPDAKKALQTAKETGNGLSLTKHKGYEVLDGSKGNDVYVIFDSEPELQIEIFSPNPGEARLLANSGALQPIE